MVGIVMSCMVYKRPCQGIPMDPVGDYGVDREFICRKYREKLEFAPALVVDYDTVRARVEPTKERKTR